MSLFMNISLRIQLCPKHIKLPKTYNILSTLRLCSTQTISPLNDRSNDGQVANNDFKEIYRFRYTLLGYAINKWKWSQTVLTAVALPASAALYFSGIFEFDLFMGIILAGGFVTGNVYVYGSLFYNTVGFMYLSEDESTIKISYLGFWGDRVDKEMPVDDIKPFSDCSHSPIDYVYRTIHCYSAGDTKLKLFLKSGGQITDKKKFIRVFGDYTKY